MSHKCRYCDKCFSRKSVLTDHVMIHTGETSAQCSVCQRNFRQNGQLVRHMKEVHAGKKRKRGEKKHLCEYCARRFENKEDLKRHKRTHTGEKPFQCSLCDRRFSVKCNLTAHVKNIHSEKRCSKCDKCCSQSDTLTVPLKPHRENELARYYCINSFRKK